MAAAKQLVQPPMAATHVFPSLSVATSRRIHRAAVATNQKRLWKSNKFCGFGELQHHSWRRTISVAKDAEQQQQQQQKISSHLPPGEQMDNASVAQLKATLHDSIQGINRGIFGVPSAKKAEIEEVVKMLESLNPTPQPTLNLEKVAGKWKLVYSTITILGSKRTKLGLRDFITLGDFWQIIDVAEGKAVNVVKFNARGLSLLSGQLQIDASFQITSESRVDIRYNSSTITPDQLMNVFQKNYDLLLSIFNPEGWLEITYVDDSLRIGRDDKGNLFILERSQGNP